MITDYTDKINELNLKKERLELLKKNLIESITIDINNIKNNLDFCLDELSKSILVDGENIDNFKIFNDSVKLDNILYKINNNVIPDIESEIKLVSQDIEYYNNLMIQGVVS